LVQEMVLPTLQQQPGFKGYLGLVNRQSGKSLAISLWESAADMQAVEEAANQVRSKSLGVLHAESPSVERFEVPINGQSAGRTAACARAVTTSVTPANYSMVVGTRRSKWCRKSWRAPAPPPITHWTTGRTANGLPYRCGRRKLRARRISALTTRR